MSSKEKLKIGVVVDQLVPGGVQKSAIEEAKNLKALGHEVTLFVLVRLHYDYQYQDLSRGLKLIFLSDFNPWLFRQAIRIPYFAFLTHLHLLNPFFAHRYTILKNLDFIISHGTTTCITAQAISRKLKVPYMAFIWDPMIFIWEKVYGPRMRLLSYLIKPLVRHYERSFLISAALVATSSRVHQQFIKKVYRVDPIIIHPGCFPPRTLPKKSDQYILGYTRWELAKNPQLFLWLAKKLPQARFLMAGYWTNHQEEEEFKKQIKRNRLEDRIKLLSPITGKDLRKIAASSFTWVHPNFEAFGMAGLEMAALGLPIIIPKGSGVTELFRQKEHGFFPPSGDKKAYLAHLQFLLKNLKKASQMGQAAAKVARHYTWRKHSQIVLENIKSYQRQKKIVCLANAFVSNKSTGGGDRFLIELARRLPKSVHLTIILSLPGFHHYQKAGVKNSNIRYLVLPPNRFDNQDRPIPLFLAYFIRSLQTYFLLPKLPVFQGLYAGTDLIPDTIPAYLYHRAHPKTLWFSRLFHFIEPPLKREGRLWVNIGSHLRQRLALRLLASADFILVDNPGLKRKLVERGIIPEKVASTMGKETWNSVKKNYFWEANTRGLLRIIKKALLSGRKLNLTILETGRTRGTSLAGGDKLMEPMAIRLTDKYNFTIIVSRLGVGHWLKAPLKKKTIILPQNRFDQGSSPIPVFFTYCVRMWQTYQRLKEQKKIDILYSSTNILPDILPAYFAKRKKREALWVARIHHLIPPPLQRKGHLYVNMVSYLMQILALTMIKDKADLVIALNTQLEREFLKAGFPKEKLVVLGAGVEFRQIARFKPDKKISFEGIFLGRLHPAKGVFDTIPIWQEVIKKKPQAKLAIIGKGPTDIKAELKDEIKKAGLSQNIKLLGFLPYSKVFPIMRNSRVFLFLDREAGWGLAVAEAMSCGLPVIGYDIGILGDVFKKGFLTIPKFDHDFFAQTIIDLVQNKSKHEKLAKAALSQARQFDWEKTSQNFSQILDEYIKNEKKA